MKRYYTGFYQKEIIMTTQVSLRDFTVNGATKVMSSEASTLFGRGRWGSDALLIKSHRTDKELLFTLHHTDMDEGDVVGWWYTCKDLPDWRVLVIND